MSEPDASDGDAGPSALPGLLRFVAGLVMFLGATAALLWTVRGFNVNCWDDPSLAATMSLRALQDACAVAKRGAWTMAVASLAGSALTALMLWSQAEILARLVAGRGSEPKRPPLTPP